LLKELRESKDTWKRAGAVFESVTVLPQTIKRQNRENQDKRKRIESRRKSLRV